VRSRHAVILATLLAVPILAGVAWATGNVLLPPDSGGPIMPNLGLLPAEPAPNPPVEVHQGAGGGKVNSQTQTKYSPVTGTSAPPKADASPSAPLPTQVRRGYVPPGPTHKLTIALAETTLWTPDDIDTVSSELGLAKGSVKSECRTGMIGMVIASHNVKNFDSHSTTSMEVNYNDALSQVSLTTYAACGSAPKLSPKSYIPVRDNKYIITLSSAFCTAPAGKTPSSLLIARTKSITDTCSFQ
jgi:hypothetical protein